MRFMRLAAVTFDFWSTLVDGTITPERTAERLSRLHRALVGAGHACSPEDLGAAFERALEQVTSAARETYQDVGPPGRWAALAKELGSIPGVVEHGLFIQMAHIAVLAGAQGVETIERSTDRRENT